VTAGIEGSVRRLAAWEAEGPILVTAGVGPETVLTAVDLSGRMLWRQSFDAGPIHLSRVAQDDTVWILCRSGTEAAFAQVDQRGVVLRTLTPDSSPGEQVASFVVLPDGLCVMWLPPTQSPEDSHVAFGRVAVYSNEGAELRSTSLDLGRLSYSGLVEWRADDEWKGRPKDPWVPMRTEVGRFDPLLVSGNRIAASLADTSGVGVTFFIAADTGAIVNRTLPGPGAYNAILGPGEFLLGYQGYGAFSATHYNDRGDVEQTWPSHLMPLVCDEGSIRGPESENIIPSRSSFAVLEPDGTVTRGGHVSGYQTSFPALDHRGTAVFWRNGELLAADPDFTIRRLFEFRASEEHCWPSNTVLMSEGLVAIAISGARRALGAQYAELLILRKTGLGTLHSGPWPSADGGLRGNPVAYA
jgi:hypothetical protein